MTGDEDRLLREHRDKINLLVDCGAFTYWSMKKPTPDVYDYMDWLGKLQCTPDHYFALDVIGDPAKTLDNLRIMRKEGLNPVPIFQLGADWNDMPEYQAGADRVAFGGIVGKATHVQWMYQNKPVPKRVHWLGVSNVGLMSHHRPTSVDNSSVWGARRFGALRLYMGKGRWTQLKRNLIPTPEQRQAVRRLGLDPSLLRTGEGWRGSDSTMLRVTLAGYLDWMKDLRRYEGVNLYVAIAGGSDIRLFMAAARERFEAVQGA